MFSFLFGSKLVRQVPGETGGLQGSWSPEIVPPCADLLMDVCYASSGQPRGGASCPPRRRSPLPLRRSPSSRRPALPRRDPFPASTLSAPPRSLYTVFTITRQRYGSRVAFTTGIWSARLGGTRGRRSASPETVTGPTENSSLLSQRSRSVLREQWLRCSDTVRGFRPGHVPPCVPDITARFATRHTSICREEY